MRDLFHNLAVIGATVAAPTDTTAVVSPIVDIKGYRSVMFAIATGTLADTDATFAALLEESDASDMSGATAVADADMHGTEAAASFGFADDNAEKKIGYHGNKRYCRLTVTPTANSGAAPITIMALGMPRELPAA